MHGHGGNRRDHRRLLHQDTEGLLPAGRHRPGVRQHARLPRHLLPAPCRYCSSASPRSSSHDPAVEAVGSSVGGGGYMSAVNQGRMFINLKPRSVTGQSTADVIATGCGRSCWRSAACRYSWRRQRTSGPADARRARPTSSRCGAPTSIELITWAPKVIDRLQRDARPDRRQQRPRAGRPSAQRGDRPQRRVAARASRSRTSTRRSTMPSRSGRSRPSTRPATSIA